MDTITYSDARARLAKIMEEVCDEHTPVVITRKNNRPVVMMSLEDYHALEETADLLHSARAARRLLMSIAELETGSGTVRKLLKRG